MSNAYESFRSRSTDGTHSFCLSGYKSIYMYVLYVPGLSKVQSRCDILFEARTYKMVSERNGRRDEQAEYRCHLRSISYGESVASGDSRKRCRAHLSRSEE